MLLKTISIRLDEITLWSFKTVSEPSRESFQLIFRTILSWKWKSFVAFFCYPRLIRHRMVTIIFCWNLIFNKINQCFVPLMLAVDGAYILCKLYHWIMQFKSFHWYLNRFTRLQKIWCAHIAICILIVYILGAFWTTQLLYPARWIWDGYS